MIYYIYFIYIQDKNKDNQILKCIKTLLKENA